VDSFHRHAGQPQGDRGLCKRFRNHRFSARLKSIQVPTLIIHGTEDKTVPIDASGRAAASAIPSSTLLEYEGAPHGLFATHRERLIEDLLAFLKQ
jgi:non-heme chloroperoxidase